MAVTPLRSDGQARIFPRATVAGAVRLVRRGEQDDPDDPLGWKTLSEHELAPGGVLRLR